MPRTLQAVVGLLAAGLSPALAPLRTIGYEEIIAHLRGEMGLDEAVAHIQRNTRRYAKRQSTFMSKYLV